MRSGAVRPRTYAPGAFEGGTASNGARSMTGSSLPWAPEKASVGRSNCRSSSRSVSRALRTGPTAGGRAEGVDGEDPAQPGLHLLDVDDVGLFQTGVGPGGRDVVDLHGQHPAGPVEGELSRGEPRPCTPR
ncbi:hypothetical protein SCALM49S_06623 [Streptomyces californicus]